MQLREYKGNKFKFNQFPFCILDIHHLLLTTKQFHSINLYYYLQKNQKKNYERKSNQIVQFIEKDYNLSLISRRKMAFIIVIYLIFTFLKKEEDSIGRKFNKRPFAR